MAGKGGGAWKVAYADFVTAMMAFFLVMWITGQSQKVKESVAGYFDQPPLTSRRPQRPKPYLDQGYSHTRRKKAKPSGGASNGDKDKSNSRSSAEESDEANANRPQLFVLHDGTSAREGTLVTFDPQSSRIDEQAKQRLDALAPSLLGKRNKIEIRGHSTASSHSEHAADKWRLCYDRCQAVLAYLVEKGVESERFRLSQAGPFEPFTLREEVHEIDENDRVEIFTLAEFVDDLRGTSLEREELVLPDDQVPAH